VSSSNTILRYVRNLVAAECGRELTDRELLERFHGRREETAFAALVRRHGSMVWRLSLGILQNEQTYLWKPSVDPSRSDDFAKDVKSELRADTYLPKHNQDAWDRVPIPPTQLP
jgi:hypothetical protein